ncbi:MAG TPA: hypothetical protein VGD74_09840 [Vulgatibacter sp.]
MTHPLSARLLSLSLEGLDALDGEDLIAFAREDERPLQGLAGLVDWRACGKLTRMLKAGDFSGAPGEAVITLPAGSLRIRRLFLMGEGMGLEGALRRVRLAGGDRVALAAAGPLEAALRAGHTVGLDSVTLLDPDPRGAEQRFEAALRSLPWLRRAGPKAEAGTKRTA